MKVNVIYFASLRDSAKKSNETIETNKTTVNELYDELNGLYNFAIDRDHLRVAINEEYKGFDTKMNAGDTIVFIPPVAGG